MLQVVMKLREWMEAMAANPLLAVGVVCLLAIAIWPIREPLWSALVAISRVAIIAGCAMLFVAALIVTAEVIIRKAIPDSLLLISWLTGLVGVNLTNWAGGAGEWVKRNWAFSGSDELSGYLFAVGTTWAMSHVLITRGHVRIDVLYGRLSPRVRAILDIVSLLLLAVFVGALLERAFNVASTNLVEYNRSNTNLRIPLAWSQVPWFLGIVLFFLTTLTAIVRSLTALVQGDLATINEIAGASSQDDEIESELKGLGIETPHGGKPAGAGAAHGGKT